MEPQILFVIFIAVLVGGALSAAYYFFRYSIGPKERDTGSLITATKENQRTGKKSISDSLSEPHTSSRATVPIKTIAEALEGTKKNFLNRLIHLDFSSFSKNSPSSAELEKLEEVLLTSDLGSLTAQKLLEKVGDKLTATEKRDIETVRSTLKAEMLNLLKTPADLLEKIEAPTVWMIVGVNGAGKTTTIGKLASQAIQKGYTVMIVAGDTFRAAADSQLKVWAERSGSLYFSNPMTKDPSAVVFQALEKAKAQKIDLILIDTAGRLHTQSHLMDELKKMKRVMSKIVNEAPHQTLLVLDANNGQNALFQAREFHAALELTGFILTKLDGTSKGGIAIGLSAELQLPIQFIGIGESVEDLKPFSPRDFVDSIL